MFIRVRIFVVSAPTNVVPTSNDGGENCTAPLLPTPSMGRATRLACLAEAIPPNDRNTNVARPATGLGNVLDNVLGNKRFGEQTFWVTNVLDNKRFGEQTFWITHENVF